MSDLTKEEQTNVRTALRFLRSRVGAWEPLGKALRIGGDTLARITGGRYAVSASVAVRVARFAGVAIEDVLDGTYPAPGTCPHCGHCPDEAAGTVGNA